MEFAGHKGGFAPPEEWQLMAQTLAKYRHQAEMSQKALATQLGVSLGTIRNWEGGRTKPQRRSWKDCFGYFPPVFCAGKF
jgi:DNA-binding XRE family transcriptional regulator